MIINSHCRRHFCIWIDMRTMHQSFPKIFVLHTHRVKETLWQAKLLALTNDLVIATLWP